jgi:ubiquinone/menaquinone biosynthesis C-methylase UbiE
VVDVAQIQLDNLAKKVKNMENVSLYQQDSSQLQFIDSQFDSVIVFFLLHEMPQEVRAKTIEEALRVLKPGGKAVFVDYHRPYWANPFRYIMYPVLKFLEPFALDLWSQEISTHMKDVKDVQKITYFGGLYQKVVVTK